MLVKSIQHSIYQNDPPLMSPSSTHGNCNAAPVSSRHADKISNTTVCTTAFFNPNQFITSGSEIHRRYSVIPNLITNNRINHDELVSKQLIRNPLQIPQPVPQPAISPRIFTNRPPLCQSSPRCSEESSNPVSFLHSREHRHSKPNISGDGMHLDGLQPKRHFNTVFEGMRLVGPSSRYFWKFQDKPLGSGYTSTVHKGFDALTGQAVAVKVVPKPKQRLLASDQYYRKLYSRLPEISHPNLLRLHAFFEDAKNFYVISDLCNGPDLVDFVLEFEPGSIPIETSKRLTVQILLGLHQLHSAQILHRDVKLDNILFLDSSRQHINLIDFDMGLLQDIPTPPKRLSNPEEVSVVGTKDYMAPECYRGIYNFSSDLWSLGVILFIFLDGHFPFNFASVGRGHCEAREVLRKGIRISSQLRRRYPMAVDLMQKLLKLEPSERIQSAFEALSHPWLNPAPRLIHSDILLQNNVLSKCDEDVNNNESGEKMDTDTSKLKIRVHQQNEITKTAAVLTQVQQEVQKEHPACQSFEKGQRFLVENDTADNDHKMKNKIARNLDSTDQKNYKRQKNTQDNTKRFKEVHPEDITIASTTESGLQLSKNSATPNELTIGIPLLNRSSSQEKNPECSSTTRNITLPNVAAAECNQTLSKSKTSDAQHLQLSIGTGTMVGSTVVHRRGGHSKQKGDHSDQTTNCLGIAYPSHWGFGSGSTEAGTDQSCIFTTASTTGSALVVPRDGSLGSGSSNGLEDSRDDCQVAIAITNTSNGMFSVGVPQTLPEYTSSSKIEDMPKRSNNHLKTEVDICDLNEHMTVQVNSCSTKDGLVGFSDQSYLSKAATASSLQRSQGFQTSPWPFCPQQKTADDNNSFYFSTPDRRLPLSNDISGASTCMDVGPPALLPENTASAFLQSPISDSSFNLQNKHDRPRKFDFTTQLRNQSQTLDNSLQLIAPPAADRKTVDCTSYNSSMAISLPAQKDDCIVNLGKSRMLDQSSKIVETSNAICYLQLPAVDNTAWGSTLSPTTQKSKSRRSDGSFFAPQEEEAASEMSISGRNEKLIAGSILQGVNRPQVKDYRNISKSLYLPMFPEIDAKQTPMYQQQRSRKSSGPRPKPVMSSSFIHHHYQQTQLANNASDIKFSTKSTERHHLSRSMGYFTESNSYQPLLMKTNTKNASVQTWNATNPSTTLSPSQCSRKSSQSSPGSSATFRLGPNVIFQRPQCASLRRSTGVPRGTSLIQPCHFTAGNSSQKPQSKDSLLLNHHLLKPTGEVVKDRFVRDKFQPSQSPLTCRHNHQRSISGNLPITGELHSVNTPFHVSNAHQQSHKHHHRNCS